MSNNTTKPPNNGIILTNAHIICREAVPACHTLKFMGPPQPSTPMQTNNTTATALGVVNDNITKKLKLMDMKYHWLHDRMFLGQIRHYWFPGKENNGDYVTKHHAPIHHQATRPTFLTSLTIVQTLQNWLSSLLPAARVC